MMKNSDFKVYLSVYHDEVTGSRILLTIVFPDGRVYRILIDCGYFQEIQYRYLNYVDDLDPTTIDAILVTHNHIDHTGLLPKMVKQGYRNPIYMTEITKELLPKYLLDSCEQQADNARYLKDKYPGDEWKFDALYRVEDVNRTMSLCQGVKFEKTLEIVPGVKATFFINGHILGAAMILVQCTAYGRKPINILFTGDYKLHNPFFEVPTLPMWLKKMDLIVVHESTYGTTTASNIKVCFKKNLLEAFKRKQHVLIGAFAQGRMQEVLYDLKLMQDEGLIPEDYEICIDGPLGIDTTYSYQRILQWFNPEKSDFIPKKVRIIDPKSRDSILSYGGRKIIVTTSGMLSNGPARLYVPMFICREDCMIHLIGYAAEETLARTLLEAKRADVVSIGNSMYQKRAVVKTTREKTSHAPLNEILEFIEPFDNIVFMAINHGEEDVKNGLKETVREECPNVKMVDCLDRNNMYCIHQLAKSDDNFSNIVVKKQPAKLQVVTPSQKQIAEKKRDQKRIAKRKAKAKKKAAKRKAKVRHAK